MLEGVPNGKNRFKFGLKSLNSMSIDWMQYGGPSLTYNQFIFAKLKI
jgi:hypothetical protein